MARVLPIALVATVAVACGDAPTDVTSDELQAHCERRCEFQATCVPELRDIIQQCITQCRASFDDTEAFTQTCTEADVRIPNDPPGPYLVHSVVTYQSCLIDRGCDTMAEPCPESRELCLDDLGPSLRCRRDRSKAYTACSEDHTACIVAMMGDVCAPRLRRCYDEAAQRFMDCG